MKKVIFFVFLLSILCFCVYAQSESVFSIHAAPGAEIPLSFGTELFSTGAGLDLAFELRMPFWPVLGLFADLSYSYMPLQTGDGINFLNGGGGLSFTLPRLGGIFLPALFAKGGYYYGVIGDQTAESGGNIYFGGGGRFSWIVLPNFNLGLEVQYKNYLDGLGGMLHHGLDIGLSGTLNFHGSSKIDVKETFFKDIFPVQYKYYAENSIGRIEIVNSGTVPFEDIMVSVFIQNYMDNPSESSGPKILGTGEGVDIELYALFSEKVLDITEATIVSAEITIDYMENGKEMQKMLSEPVRIYDRHAMTWDDTRKAAAFVNYKDPSVIAAGKMLSHLVKSTVNVIDVNFCTAVAVHEALNAYGIEYVIDPTSPFTEYSENSMSVDFLQFPSNTLEFKSGDCDDLSILYTSLLQSVGIDTAFITVPGHIFIAFALKIDPAEVRKAFSSADEIFEYGGRSWVPVEITMIANPFMQAWKAGANQWNEYSIKGEAEIFPMSGSWQDYEPVGYGSKGRIQFIEESIAEEVYLREIERFINKEIYAQTEPLKNLMIKNGENAANLNRVGTVYARYGKNAAADEYFSKAMKLDDYYPAFVNSGNIMLIENDLQGALSMYRKAEQLNSRSAALYLQMSRAYSALGLFSEAEESFNQVKKRNPELAKRYSFIDISSSSGSRASGYSLSDNMLWIDNEE